MSYTMNDHTDEVLNALEKAVERGLEAIGQTAEGYAKDETPVDTGRLRNSISHKVEDEAVYIGTNVKYAPYVELGTSKMPPRPYLKPAATEHSPEYKKLMEDSMKNA